MVPKQLLQRPGIYSRKDFILGNGLLKKIRINASSLAQTLPLCIYVDCRLNSIYSLSLPWSWCFCVFPAVHRWVNKSRISISIIICFMKATEIFVNWWDRLRGERATYFPIFWKSRYIIMRVGRYMYLRSDYYIMYCDFENHSADKHVGSQ